MNYGPQHLETLWLAAESKIVNSLANKKWTKPFALFLFVLIAFPIFFLWTRTILPASTRFYLIQDRLWAAYILVGASFFPLFIKHLRHQPLFLILVVSVSWLFPLFKINSLSLFSFAPIFFILFGNFLVHQSSWNRWLRLSLVIIFFCGLVTLLTFETLSQMNSKTLFYFSNIHLDILILFFAGLIFSSQLPATAICFNPLLLYAPLPIPDSSTVVKSEDAYERQYMRGVLQIISAQIIFAIIILLFKTELITETMNPFVGYAIFLSIVIGAFKNVTGILWIFGIQSAPATYFLLLSKSPIEIWQRGSVFFADFLFNKVYLPTWKRFRSIWLPSLLVTFTVLLHLFIFHEFLLKSLLRWQFGNSMFGSFGLKELSLWALWLVVWFVWVVAFMRLKQMTTRWHQSEFFQWVLIILTHLGTMVIFPLVQYLARVLGI